MTLFCFAGDFFFILDLKLVPFEDFFYFFLGFLSKSKMKNRAGVKGRGCLEWCFSGFRVVLEWVLGVFSKPFQTFSGFIVFFFFFKPLSGVFFSNLSVDL